MTEQVKYRIEAFKDFVPHTLRFIILLITAIIYQFPNTIYMTNLNEVVGTKALTVEDVRFVSISVLVGMMVAFPILFRLKFRFTTRTILLGTSVVIILGNVICMYSSNMLILIAVSLVLGFSRMLGNFECLSNIRMIITPKRDMARYYLVIYSIIILCIQFSSILSASVSDTFDWRYMYVLVVAVQLVVMVILFFLLRPIRLSRKMPLYQIDWIGMALWGSFLMLSVFVLEYGKRLDWFDSDYIIEATFIALLTLGLAVQRMFTIRRPLITPEIFKYKNLMHAILLFAAMHLFLITTSTIMVSYTEGVLHYDHVSSASLNWLSIVGVGIAIAFTFYWKLIYNGGFKRIIFLGFLALVMNHVILYFVFQSTISKETLYLPYLLRGFGYMILYLNITLYAISGLPFSSFFSALCFMGFVRTILGSSIASSGINSFVQYLQKENMSHLSANIDYTNVISNDLYVNAFDQSISMGQSVEQASASAMNTLYNSIYTQSMLLSWKDVFGGISLIGIGLLLYIVLRNYRVQLNQQFPKMKTIWKSIWGRIY